MGRDPMVKGAFMTLRPLAAALLAAAALGLAACGGDEETPASAASGATDDEKVREAQVKFAECMRENGVDMPDPQAGGKQTFKVGGDSGISPEEFEEASKACEKYQQAIRPNLSEEEKTEMKEQALENARCMREHGIDMPDPTFSADGGVQMRVGPGSKLDPEDPEFQAAQKECGGGLMKGRQP
jgi:hypothetical protein